MDYTISNARYAKGQMLVRCARGDGYKARCGRLADALSSRYTHRENAYVMSPTRAQVFEILYAAGWDVSTGFDSHLRPYYELEAPCGDRFPTSMAKQLAQAVLQEAG